MHQFMAREVDELAVIAGRVPDADGELACRIPKYSWVCWVGTGECRISAEGGVEGCSFTFGSILITFSGPRSFSRRAIVEDHEELLHVAGLRPAAAQALGDDEALAGHAGFRPFPRR